MRTITADDKELFLMLTKGVQYFFTISSQLDIVKSHFMSRNKTERKTKKYIYEYQYCVNRALNIIFILIRELKNKKKYQ